MLKRLALSAFLFAAILMVVAGCSKTYRIVLKGPAFTARPQNCQIVFSDVDPDRAAVEYQQIGLISVDGFEGELDEGIKEELRQRACTMGGEIIVPMGTDQGVEEFTSSFLVLTAKVGLDE